VPVLEETLSTALKPRREGLFSPPHSVKESRFRVSGLIILTIKLNPSSQSALFKIRLKAQINGKITSFVILFLR